MQKFIKYGAVAIGSAAVDWGVFSILVLVSFVDPLLSLMLSRLSGGLFSFTANKYWSFQSREDGKLIEEAKKFLFLYVFSYFLSILFFFILSEISLVSVFIAKLATDSSIFVINYHVMSYFVFSNRFTYFLNYIRNRNTND